MTSQTIEVIISPTGETTIQTRGYAGGVCLQASKWLEEALGIPTSDRKTTEFYQPNNTQQKQENKA